MVIADRPNSPFGAPPAGRDDAYPQTSMRVTKRNGNAEPVDVNKIVRAVSRSCVGLTDVDSMRVATKTISGLYDGATTQELDQLSIQTAAALIVEEPQYARLAGRLLSVYIDKEVRNQDIFAFSQSIQISQQVGLVNERLAKFVADNSRKLNDAIVAERDKEFEYFGLRTLYDRYLLKHPTNRRVLETPQYFFLRVACALSESVADALELYGLFSSLKYMPSSPTLFNAGTNYEQLSSCFLLDSPQDELSSIYERYKDVALLSKFSGGIGISYTRVRSRGSLIKGTNGHSNGIVPWLKTLDASVAAVNQGGKRKGAACVYLETWHADIEEFLELRDNTGAEERRTHNLNLACWVSDIFMRRVEADQEWSLFDPKITPHLPDLYGEEFDAAYEKAEADGLAVRTVRARELYARMMRTLATTGNAWMTFKDKSNRASNQTGMPGRVVHHSNLCTEIIEISSEDETAVCNLGSINLARHTYQDANGQTVFDFAALAETVSIAVRELDRVIDLTRYPIPSTETSNMRWRPVGLGLMGLQDVFFQMRTAFDSPLAREISKRISEEVYYHCLKTSNELALEKGPHATFAETRAARGELQFDAWGVTPQEPARWDALRQSIMQHGLRNSLLIAIAPTATIASISGCYECIEPQVSNLFKRETLSGDFLQVNRYLVNDLKALGLWNEDMRNRLKMSEGSIQDMVELPQQVRDVYRTAWELPMSGLIDMAADRGAFIDQSQSLNLFVENPNIGPLSSMYFYAWKKGLKTTYYLRSRPATRIAKTTVTQTAARPEPVVEAAGIATVAYTEPAPVAMPAPAPSFDAVPSYLNQTPEPVVQVAPQPVMQMPVFEPAPQPVQTPEPLVVAEPIVPSAPVASSWGQVATPPPAPTPTPVTGWGLAPAPAPNPPAPVAPSNGSAWGQIETPAVPVASGWSNNVQPLAPAPMAPSTPTGSWGLPAQTPPAAAPVRAEAAIDFTLMAPLVTEAPEHREYTDVEAVACSLENPETCEACQ